MPKDFRYKEVLLVILLDAFKASYVKHMPFLKKISKNGFIANIEGVFGFQSIEAAWSAGLYPEKSGLYSIFKYSPLTSPFKIFRRKTLQKFNYLLEKIIDAFPISIVSEQRLSYHSVSYVLRVMWARFLKYIYSRPFLTLSEVPYELLPYFDMFSTKKISEKGYLKYPTIFDILKANNKKWLYYGNPDNTLSIFNTRRLSNFIRDIKRNVYDFIFAHIIDLDNAGHLYGPNSFYVMSLAKKIDKLIEYIFTLVKKRYRNISIIIFGDHGMVPVRKTINIFNILKKLPLEIGKDYIFFIDSPSIRFWFMHERAETLIKEIMSNIKCGKFLTKDDYRRYKISFDHNEYWESLFLLNPGYIFFPNFFQSKKLVKGMHGYCPYYEENQGCLVFYSENYSIKTTKRYVRMVDIFPTMLKIMRLDIPESCQGESII